MLTVIKWLKKGWTKILMNVFQGKVNSLILLQVFLKSLIKVFLINWVITVKAN